jgi:hypothetical protein
MQIKKKKRKEEKMEKEIGYTQRNIKITLFGEHIFM